ncbi:MAG: ABC transporter ATP-binding protein [Clostridium sp.]
MFLEVKNLNKSYKKVDAVKNASFSLEKGKLAILAGPNGAGKTTTIKCILSLLKINSGEILIDGKNSKDRSVREKFAYIPESPDLYPLLTVWEHFKFIALAYKVSNWEEKANNLISTFCIEDKRNSLAKELSKGMKQKVSIIMALLHDPEIFFIDEPFIGLDPKGIRDFKELMKSLKELNITLLVSTHILATIEDLSDILIIMKNGQILECASKEELKEKYSEIDGTVEDLFFKITEQ